MLDLVPEFFYDLIARVIPGAVLMSLVLLQVLDLPAVFDLLGKATVFMSLAAGTLAYVIGFLLNAAFTWVFSLTSDMLAKLHGWLAPTFVGGALRACGVPVLMVSRELERELQHMALKHPAASARLCKMLAERTLIECLLAGLSLYGFAVQQWPRLSDSGLDWKVFAFLGAAWIVMSYGLTIRIHDTAHTLCVLHQDKSGS